MYNKEATWEAKKDIAYTYPKFNLEEKAGFKRDGIITRLPTKKEKDDNNKNAHMGKVLEYN